MYRKSTQLNAARYLPFVSRALRRKGAPLHLTLFVTGACNLRCRHCFHWKEVADSVPGPSVEKIEKLAASCEHMGPLLWVSFGGGEPFLRRDLPQLARAFGSRGLRHLAIPTNGLIERQHELVEEICRSNPDCYVSVSVSFDGPPKIHDEIRQIDGGHEKSMQAVRAFQAQKAKLPNLGVGVILTVTRENQDELAEHMEFLVKELSPDNTTINLARGTALDEALLEVNPERYAEVVATKNRLVEENHIPYFDFPLGRLAVARDRLMYEHIEGLARGSKQAHLDCTAGSLSAVIFEDGSLHPCEILGKSMGNLNDVDWDLEKLWKAPQADELRTEIRATRCSCTWECAQADNVLFNPRKWPGLLKAYPR